MSTLSDLSSRDPYHGDRWWETFLEGGLPARPQDRTTSDRTDFDVVVVGGGAAGHATAIHASERGARVVMLEAGTEGGGTAYKSSSGMWIPDNSLMRERGLAPNRDWALHHMARQARPSSYGPDQQWLGLTEREYSLIERYYDTSATAIDELIALGVHVIEFPSMTGDFEAMVEYHGDIENGFGAHVAVAQADGEFGGGPHMMAQLAQLAAERGIDLRTQHRVTDLVMVDGERVGGVAVETPSGRVEMTARLGVVFAAGGYAHNREQMAEHWPSRTYGSCAVGTARGDLIEIARGMDLPLDNMGQGWGTQHPLEMMLDNPEVAEHIGVFPGDSYIMVNPAGHRVVNEKYTYHERSKVHFEQAEDGSFPNHLLFIVYDEFVAQESTVQPNQWPSPRPGQPWVISADTLDELATAIDARLAQYGQRVDGVRLATDFVPTLAASVERFNEFARAGKDLDFQRGETATELDWTGPSHLANDKNPTMYPLSGQGPYHAIIVAGSVLDTNGGPLADADGRILRGDGRPVPGLYGVGNCVASAAGEGYWSGGSTLGPAVTFGLLAARSITQPLSN